MSVTVEQYRSAVFGLAPDGLLFPHTQDDSEVGELFSVIAQALVNVDGATKEIASELFPDRAGAFVWDWARILGFPRCELDLSTSQQREANLAWLNIGKYSTKQFFVDIAAIMGYTILVEDRNDDPTLGAFEFRVTSVATAPVTYFKSDISRAGDRLVDPGSNDPLECLINFFAPAHTTPIFNYVSNLLRINGDNLTTIGGDNLIA
jgi:uncharacterized protein YmfQ (DUF2313 family)